MNPHPPIPKDAQRRALQVAILHFLKDAATGDGCPDLMSREDFKVACFHTGCALEEILKDQFPAVASDEAMAGEPAENVQSPPDAANTNIDQADPGAPVPTSCGHQAHDTGAPFSFAA